MPASPSPLAGEGYADLAALPPSRSWMRGSEPQARAAQRRAATPHPAPSKLAKRLSKTAQPSPARGEGL